MKILHVLPSADPKTGGPAEVVRQLSHVLTSNGHVVEVATLDSPEIASRVGFPVPLIGLGPGLGSYGYSSKMGKWLRANVSRFDLVVIDAIWQYNGLAAYGALKKAHKPYVVFAHGMLSPYFKEHHPLKHLKKLGYYNLALREILSDAKVVFFFCEEERIAARRSFGRYEVNERIFPFGIQKPTYDLAKAKKDFLDLHPNLKGKRIAIFLGRIHPLKGVDILIRAYAATLAKDSNWQLVIAGPDQIGWKKQLEAMSEKLKVADLITWTGMLNKDLKWGALSAAEVFVIPSHHENFGVVVAEALAVGLPVLLSDKVNIWREVISYSAGFVAPDTEAGMVQLLTKWSNLPGDQIRAIQGNVLHCFSSRFDLETVRESMLKTFESLVQA